MQPVELRIRHHQRETFLGARRVERRHRVPARATAPRPVAPSPTSQRCTAYAAAARTNSARRRSVARGVAGRAQHGRRLRRQPRARAGLPPHEPTDEVDVLVRRARAASSSSAARIADDERARASARCAAAAAWRSPSSSSSAARHSASIRRVREPRRAATRSPARGLRDHALSELVQLDRLRETHRRDVAHRRRRGGGAAHRCGTRARTRRARRAVRAAAGAPKARAPPRPSAAAGRRCRSAAVRHASGRARRTCALRANSLQRASALRTSRGSRRARARSARASAAVRRVRGVRKILAHERVAPQLGRVVEVAQQVPRRAIVGPRRISARHRGRSGGTWSKTRVLRPPSRAVTPTPGLLPTFVACCSEFLLARYGQRARALTLRRLRRRDPELLVERVRVHRAAEERAHFLIGLLEPRGREDVVAVRHAGDRAGETLRLEPREHVLRVHLRPQIAVVAGVVAAHEVAELGLRVRAVDERVRRRRGYRRLPHRGRVDRRLGRVVLHVDGAVEDLLRRRERVVHVARGDHLLDELVGQRLARRDVRADALEDARIPCPVLEHLRRRFDEVLAEAVGERLVRLVREHRGHVVAELVEERLDVAVREQRGLARRGLRPVADDRAFGEAHGAVGQHAARDHREVREVVVLAGPRVQVEVEAPERFARRRVGDVVGLHLRLPHRHVHAGELHAEQLLVDAEHAVDDVLHREVLLDLVLVDGVLRLAQLVLVVGLVPLVERGALERGVLVALLLRFGQDRRVDLGEETLDALRRGGHPVGEHVRGPRRVAHQVREPVAGRDRVLEQLHVRVAAAVVVRDVERLARRRVGLVLQERSDGRLVDGHGVAAVGGLLERRGDEVRRQRLRLRGGDRDRRLVVAEVRLEFVLLGR